MNKEQIAQQASFRVGIIAELDFETQIALLALLSASVPESVWVDCMKEAVRTVREFRDEEQAK